MVGFEEHFREEKNRQCLFAARLNLPLLAGIRDCPKLQLETYTILSSVW